MRITAVTLAILALASPAIGQHSGMSESKDVALKNGSTVRVEAGELLVPESRQRASEREITIPYYRLRSDSPTPASPIFLLHGGPGSSWLDQFPEDNMAKEVAFYRTISDVVVFDQRGGGRSRPEMTCPDRGAVPPGRLFTTGMVADVLRDLAVRCRDRWLRAGVDLAAYNTVENAADVNDLRLALGYGKITLIGGSYGSHLALQFMRQYPNAVDRVVLFGIEGPDDTWDRPSATLATLGRIAAAAEQSPGIRRAGIRWRSAEHAPTGHRAARGGSTAGRGWIWQRPAYGDSHGGPRSNDRSTQRRSPESCQCLAGDDPGDGSRRFQRRRAGCRRLAEPSVA